MLSSFRVAGESNWVFRQDKTRDLHGAEKDSSASHEQCMRPMGVERVPFFGGK